MQQTGMNYNKISYHAYNGNHTKVAIVPNAAAYFEIWNVVGTDIKNWTLDVQVKKEHSHVITCIDWAPITNRIVTCAEDRNAFVWTPPSGKVKDWEPEIVLLRFEKAATCCAWSPNELKFAVGGAERSIGVCSYAEEEKWWVCKLIKKHQSSVLSLAWHPSNACLGSSSCDSFALINSSLVKDAKDPSSVTLPNLGSLKGCGAKESPSTFSYSSPGSWISAVAFSPSGDIFAAAGRNSTLIITDFKKKEADGSPSTTIVNTKDLPHTSLIFADENTLVAAGFDPRPSLFAFDGSNWAFKKTLTVAAETGGGGGAALSIAAQARNRFTQLDRTGQSGASVSAGALELGKDHLNSITSLQVYAREGNKADGKVLQVSTSGLDGQILFWRVE